MKRRPARKDAPSWTEASQVPRDHQDRQGRVSLCWRPQSGDPNCPTGGASLTDGSGNAAYVWNGATGSQGPTGPQGPAGSGGMEEILGAPCGNGRSVFEENALVSQASSAPFLSCG